MSESIQFSWNENKKASNLRKHGVSFDEAQTAFDDEYALVVSDERHSDFEARQLLIGYSQKNRLLLVSFIERAANRIRIISARLATRQERKEYEKKTR